MEPTISQDLLNKNDSSPQKLSNKRQGDAFEWKFCLSWCIITCAVLSVVLLIIILWLNTLHRSSMIGHAFTASVFNPFGYRQPIILAWTPFHNQSLISKFQPSKQCPYKCVFSDDKEKYSDTAQVRIFHAADLLPHDLPPHVENSMNVFFTMDSPMSSEFKWNYINNTKLKQDYFNLTISYQQDSNIQYPFDVLEPRSIEDLEEEYYQDAEVEQAIDNKTDMLLTLLSNCRSDSKRELLIQKLRQLMPMTAVGKCFDVECDKKCLKSLEKNHYFYLAFEESVCPDFLTNEFWRLKNLVVPIVLSRSVVSSYFPSYTFIAVDDFDTLQDFVNYLFQVVKDREMYKSYFAWTKTYKKTSNVQEFVDPGCELCKLAYHQKRHQLKNIEKYLSHNQCRHAFGDYLLLDRHNRSWEMK